MQVGGEVEIHQHRLPLFVYPVYKARNKPSCDNKEGFSMAG